MEWNINWIKVWYARDMMFTWRFVLDGEKMVISHIDLGGPLTRDLPPLAELIDDPFFNDVVFVHSEEEAEGLPASTVVFWPLRLDDLDVAQGLVNRLNLAALRSGTDLADFGLSYPLTVENLVDDWGAVNNFRVRAGLEFHMWWWWGEALQYGADAFIDEIEAFHANDN